jgi:FKBP-type peptidyl-prolyl cis-trans isomerase FklB
MKSFNGVIFCLILLIFGEAQAQSAKKSAPPQNAGSIAPKPVVKTASPLTGKPATAKSATPKPAGVRRAASLITDKEKASYAVGVDIGRNLKQQEIELDPAAAARGLLDFLSSQKLLLSDQEITDSIQNFRQSMMVKMQEKMKVVAEKNKMDGDKFLAENKTKPGIIVLPSGLQYKEIVPGTGPSPKATDTVETRYRGTLISGSEFDSSAKNGGPVSFPVNRVIPGWTEALQLMKVGSKWQLFIPAELAYGANSPGPEIPPNSTLIFEIELLGIK